MPQLRSTHLIILLVLLSAALVVVGELGLELPGYGPFLFANVVFGLNLAIGIFGLFTPYRTAWAVYLIASAAAYLLMGAATPFYFVWIIAMLKLGW
jgi:hypothetical protein